VAVAMVARSRKIKKDKFDQKQFQKMRKKGQILEEKLENKIKIKFHKLIDFFQNWPKNTIFFTI
jgi:hypothetical protein